MYTNHSFKDFGKEVLVDHPYIASWVERFGRYLMLGTIEVMHKIQALSPMAIGTEGLPPQCFANQKMKIKLKITTYKSLYSNKAKIDS